MEPLTQDPKTFRELVEADLRRAARLTCESRQHTSADEPKKNAFAPATSPAVSFCQINSIFFTI